MKKLLLIPLFVLLLCVSCKNTPKAFTGEIIEIKLKSNENISMPTDSIFESVEYVKLETTDESLLAEISKMRIVGSNIYIFDGRQRAILVFDKDGTFQKKLNKLGRGPGEYLDISDFEIDETYLYVVSHTSGDVFRYDINTFDYVDKIVSGQIRGYKIAVNSRYLFVYSGNNRSEDLKDFAVVDKRSGELITKYRELEFEKTGWVSASFPFAEHNDEVYCVLPFHYDIFKMDTDSYRPVFFRRFRSKEYAS